MPMSSSWFCLHSSENETDITHATLSLDSRGLAYGDGFFTTMGVIDGQILWLDYHHQRLISHQKALQLDVDSHSLITALTIHAQRLQQGVLKLIVVRAAQAVRGYGYTSNASGSACDIWLKSSAMMVKTDEQLCLPDGRRTPIQPVNRAICLSAQIACLPPPLAGLKSLNRLDTVLASAELQRIKSHLLPSDASHTPLQPNIGEGLLRDMSGCWIEGTMSNVFYQLAGAPVTNPHSLESKNTIDTTQGDSNYLMTGQWYTPSLTQSGVDGVMRQVIIDALSNTAYPVIIRPLQDDDLPHLTRLFFCNALRGIMPMANLTLLNDSVVTMA
ncbi:aminotransferase class IV [Psychrobacter sp. JB385]|uniref:aminotransferase class IV n=1 Tax=Psychrobacter sp. JB385 TaxID=1434841 RepID=UPI00097ED6B0|nr:aminotransferase class IV [Psychrobacter sp. JB385]SJN43243.1 Aminodeoxychorismate lyase [Psychrobacter sp. JB385]